MDYSIDEIRQAFKTSVNYMLSDQDYVIKGHTSDSEELVHLFLSKKENSEKVQENTRDVFENKIVVLKKDLKKPLIGKPDTKTSIIAINYLECILLKFLMQNHDTFYLDIDLHGNRISDSGNTFAPASKGLVELEKLRSQLLNKNRKDSRGWNPGITENITKHVKKCLSNLTPLEKLAVLKEANKALSILKLKKMG